ncbi:ImmA/IrrE family metallo-endopeptidase [Marinomonas foliarum]|uniref:Zn-dependent peptidase ImmA (M78 family) n=1 Tax=Marinomonas foliarum TaxID=491950 RepID=A0A368ZEN5_9GAMM|nr:ImmA/IrrE family metallo-endopeptidase [Marinomonas foliarum]RCW90404.1 Zn-dependent peptidase ImmA (M78 family) [Marinomonas foliarum]
MATQALVNPELLSWARYRSGLSDSALAKKLNVKIERIAQWELGDAKPTFKQAQSIAKYTHTPFGFLFLPKPPKEDPLPIPDLRTVERREVEQPSPELRDIITQVLKKQEWYKDYLISNELGSNPYVGSITLKTPINKAVSLMREALGVAVPIRGTWDDYQRDLIQGSENAGILVMRSGIVGNNTHRKLQVSEFRGFAITDEFAPVVFINSADAPPARLFTLIHELAHIWLGSSGISNLEPSNSTEEKYCNQVAGEFLVPESNLVEMWSEVESIATNCATIASRFHVSKLVVARRAADAGVISRVAYSDFYRAELEAFRNKEGVGGDFYRSAGAKNSILMSQAVISEARSGRLLLRDAGRLLGVSPSALKTYASKMSL